MRDAAARHLVAARASRRPGERLPEGPGRPADVADAVAIQERVRELLRAAIGGWKCSVPSAAREIAAAPIFASTINFEFALHDSVDRGKGSNRAGDRLRDRLRSSVACHALQRCGSAGGDTRNACRARADRTTIRRSRGGEVIPNSSPTASPTRAALWSVPWWSMEMALRLEAFRGHHRHRRTAKLLVRDGNHPDGHPLRPLVWLANHLAVARRWGLGSRDRWSLRGRIVECWMFA